jgi:hypothetical protein
VTGEESAILEWLKARRAIGIRRQDLAEGKASLAAELRRRGHDQLASGIETIADAESSDEAGPGVSAALAGALADYAAGAPDHERFEVVDQLLSYDEESWSLFQSRMVERLKADPATFEALKDRLAAEPALLETAPETVAMHSAIPAATLAEHHRRGAYVRGMWGSGWNGIQMRSTTEHATVRRADPVAWLGILEGHTFPDPVLSLVEGSAFDAVEELIPLLSAAAPAFDEQGGWSGERFVIFPLIAAATRLLQRLAGLGQSGQEPNGEAFAEALETIVSTLATRSDFQWSGHAWLQQLAWEDRVQRVWVPVRGKGLQDLPWVIAASLATRLEPLDDPISWIAREDATFRLDRLVATLLPIAHRSGQTSAGPVLASLVRQNVVDTSLLPRAFGGSKTLVSRTLALAISTQADTADWFSAIWRDCFAVRDRLRHAAGRAATKGRDPGALALACGCAVISGWKSAPERTDILGDLWDAMRAAVVETALTADQGPGSTCSTAARWLAISFSAVHHGMDAATRSVRLASLIGPLAADPHEHAELVSLLVEGGATVIEIDAALPGPSVKERFDRILADARRRAVEGYVQREMLGRLETLWRKVSEAGG